MASLLYLTLKLIGFLVLQAYAEEEERREALEKKRNEAQAISRWYQLLSSIVTRQRLNNCYGDHSTSQTSNNIENTKEKVSEGVGGSEHNGKSHECEGQTLPRKSEFVSMVTTEEHEHVFLTDDHNVDEQSFTRTKRCRCGFSIQVEEFQQLRLDTICHGGFQRYTYAVQERGRSIEIDAHFFFAT